MKIISTDGREFNIEKKYIKSTKRNPYLSNTIKNLLDDTGDEEDVCIELEEIEKKGLEGDVIEVVIEYCKKQYENPPLIYEGDEEEIINIMREHKKYHENVEIKNCEYKIIPKPVTYWEKLEKGIKPLIKDEINEVDMWEHLRNMHENGFCCEDDDIKEENMGKGKEKYCIEEWSERILKKYMNEVVEKKIDECLITRIGIAADFLDIKKLQEDVAKILSEYIEEIIDNKQELRRFLNVEDDIGDEKNDIEEIISMLDI